MMVGGLVFCVCVSAYGTAVSHHLDVPCIIIILPTQWCENCKLMAPTLLQIEEEYKDKVNFVMVNGDKRDAWPLIEAFGVDAIPHLALVSSEGDVETALIGPIPKRVLRADLDGT